MVSLFGDIVGVFFGSDGVSRRHHRSLRAGETAGHGPQPYRNSDALLVPESQSFLANVGAGLRHSRACKIAVSGAELVHARKRLRATNVRSIAATSVRILRQQPTSLAAGRSLTRGGWDTQGTASNDTTPFRLSDGVGNASRRRGSDTKDPRVLFPQKDGGRVEQEPARACVSFRNDVGEAVAGVVTARLAPAGRNDVRTTLKFDSARC